MKNINSVTIEGRLVRDPEARNFNGGGCKISFAIAVDDPRKDKSGQWDNNTSFIDVAIICGANDAERGAKLAGMIGKGKNIVVQGALKQESWDDKATGSKRSKIFVQTFPSGIFVRDLAKTVAAPKPKEDDGESQSEEDVPF